jgi:BirA family biotin operon repressor/biotin-[acetyl-CoA-carboxylase] ligase
MAGILIETAITAGEMSRAIVGIGLNINQTRFVSDAPNPVSLKNLTGIDYNLGEMLAGLCKALDKRYLTLLHGDFESIHADYEQSLYRRGIWTNFRADGIDFEGMIKGVGNDGKLMMETMDGAGRGFYFKEVVFK